MDNLQTKVDNSGMWIYHYQFAFILAALQKDIRINTFYRGRNRQESSIYSRYQQTGLAILNNPNRQQ